MFLNSVQPVIALEHYLLGDGVLRGWDLERIILMPGLKQMRALPCLLCNLEFCINLGHD